ncbi:MAG TPA: alpha/beta fold hydrolase [Gemmatirosa sp.]
MHIPPWRGPLAALVLLGAASAGAQPTTADATPALPAAIATDPPHDPQHPARMQVLHIPSGDVRINGVAYLAAGAGAHPTLVLLHGLPGNEKNLDLAQAVRRAGWHVVTFNYRGSWGSPGAFRFAQTLGDADAVLAFLRDTATARALGVDTTRLVLAGHSMGGWATVHTAAHDRGLRGAVLISAADMGLSGVRGAAARPQLVAGMADNMESLAGVTAEQMADELIANGERWRFERAEAGLARTPLLVLTSDDGLAPAADALAATVRASGNARVTTVHVATDHAWSDRRVALEAAVVRWLDALR